MKKILVIGGGAMGSAFTIPCIENNNKVTITEPYDKIFVKLVEAIEESSLGSMLGMLGGKKALDPLKEPVKKKIKELFNDISFKKIDENLNPSEKLKGDIENIIDKRLEELTPEHIKIIMKEMIQKHLGWLVVWGGVFGFLIGLSLGILGSLN